MTPSFHSFPFFLTFVSATTWAGRGQHVTRKAPSVPHRLFEHCHAPTLLRLDFGMVGRVYLLFLSNLQEQEEGVTIVVTHVHCGGWVLRRPGVQQWEGILGAAASQQHRMQRVVSTAPSAWAFQPFCCSRMALHLPVSAPCAVWTRDWKFDESFDYDSNAKVVPAPFARQPLSSPPGPGGYSTVIAL